MARSRVAGPATSSSEMSLERIPGRARTVALHVPGTNTYLAEGVWTHNDLSGLGGGRTDWAAGG